MSRVERDLEPRIAASRALDALLEAGRYSGYGLNAAGVHMGRRTVAAAAEGARRTGGAWSALQGTKPAPPRRASGFAIGAAAGSAFGVLAALMVRRGIVAWAASDPEAPFGRRLRGMLRPTRPAADAPTPPVDVDIAAAPTSQRDGVVPQPSASSDVGHDERVRTTTP
ncbi:MAG TPA: hypothetical protein VF657_24065 [Actinoplanes sp.]|jgi:hypothetical protein